MIEKSLINFWQNIKRSLGTDNIFDVCKRYEKEKDRQTEGWMNGWMDRFHRRTDRWTDGMKEKHIINKEELPLYKLWRHIEGEGLTPLIHNIDTAFEWVVSFVPWPPFSQEMRHRYPLNRKLGGHQSSSGRFREEKSMLPLPKFEKPFFSCASRNLVTTLPALSFLQKQYKWKF
jgi:hypothetical protein